MILLHSTVQYKTDRPMCQAQMTASYNSLTAGSGQTFETVVIISTSTQPLPLSSSICSRELTCHQQALQPTKPPPEISHHHPSPFATASTPFSPITPPPIPFLPQHSTPSKLTMTLSSDPPPSDNTESSETTTAASIIAFLSREVLSAAIALAGVYLSAKVIKRVMDPNYEARERTRARRQAVFERLFRTGVPRDAMRGLSASEESLLHELVFPEDIASDFESVGGLRGTKETLKELIVYPLLFPDVYRAGEGGGGLLSPPKGVLLYGPPGTGKTLLAKALAKESGANFLALSPSSLLSKWLGDTEQLARAVFSLARRVQPTVIFIDEIDGLFRERTSSEHEVHKNLKAEFMQLWDGLTTDDRYNQVVVLGATNRPYDVDPAILRRMPRPFEVGLPDIQERVEILRKVLEEVDVEIGFDYARVAEVTQGYSGSDLKELCRAAMMTPVRESLRIVAKQRRMRMSTTAGLTQNSGAVHEPLLLPKNSDGKLRPLTLADVLKAREEVTRPQEQSASYEARTQGSGLRGQSEDKGFAIDMDLFAQMVQALSRAQ